MNGLNGYARVRYTWWRVILVAVVLAVSVGACGGDSPAKRASSAPAVVAQTSDSTSSSRLAAQPPSSSRAKLPGLTVPESAVTVPDRWGGPGRSAGQFVGGMFIKGCRAATLVGLFPKIRGGQTPVALTVRGISGRAHGFLVKQVVQIDNEGDPVEGGADLPRLRSGRYFFSVRFAGDAERSPTTLERVQEVSGHC